MAWIFHILTKEEWNHAQKEGVYKPQSLETEGFIHMSKTDQLLYVANSIFKDKKHLKLLKVWDQDVTAKIVDEAPKEAAQSGHIFPHIYGALNLDAVKEVFDFISEENGKFKYPKNLLSS